MPELLMRQIPGPNTVRFEFLIVIQRARAGLELEGRGFYLIIFRREGELGGEAGRRRRRRK
jgi:hypothetical protein